MILLIFLVTSLAEQSNNYDLQLFKYFEEILFTKYLVCHFF